jgi:G3E family GTPase
LNSSSPAELFAGKETGRFGRRQRRVRGARIPVTVVTGFLGSGKTTLIRELLARPEGADTAVVINEYGEVGIDDALLRASSDATVLLGNGCVCCTVRTDLQESLRALYADRARGAVPSFRRVIIETSGLADPGPVLQTFASDRALGEEFHLQALVTVVDAPGGTGNLARMPEARHQVALADRIVLSKTDLIDATALRVRLHRLNPGAPLLSALHGEVDAAALLHAGLFDPGSKIPDVRGWLDAEAYAEYHHHHGHDVNRHDARITAFCLTIEEPLHWQGIATWLDMLIATRGESLLRIKGILNIAGQDRPVAIHGVQHLFHPPALLSAWPDGDARTSRLVFITRDLPRDVIEEGLHAFNNAAAR